MNRANCLLAAFCIPQPAGDFFLCEHGSKIVGFFGLGLTLLRAITSWQPTGCGGIGAALIPFPMVAYRRLSINQLKTLLVGSDDVTAPRRHLCAKVGL
ncbi:hypothetical protein [Natronohydrobacter thiooxidans]|uniref:hypothetical protein n=1 Tax=Natronohydrobacter thiooxidans TaxID=87172 RepID=UPI001114E68B|nr:hypothetical protein [Natronohydrobacter thiooxidans]